MSYWTITIIITVYARTGVNHVALLIRRRVTGISLTDAGTKGCPFVDSFDAFSIPNMWLSSISLTPHTFDFFVNDDQY